MVAGAILEPKPSPFDRLRVRVSIEAPVGLILSLSKDEAGPALSRERAAP